MKKILVMAFAICTLLVASNATANGYSTYYWTSPVPGYELTQKAPLAVPPAPGYQAPQTTAPAPILLAQPAEGFYTAWGRPAVLDTSIYGTPVVYKAGQPIRNWVRSRR